MHASTCNFIKVGLAIDNCTIYGLANNCTIYGLDDNCTIYGLADNCTIYGLAMITAPFIARD